MSAVDVMYTCKGCGWTYSLQRSDACPMCKAEPEIDQKMIIDILQEYCRRQGLFASKNKSKTIVKEFKKRSGRLPNFKECWDLAKVVLKKETAATDVSDVITKATKKKEDKDTEKEKRRREKEVKKKREEATASEIKCPSCGNINPTGSKFCLECGTQL